MNPDMSDAINRIIRTALQVRQQWQSNTPDAFEIGRNQILDTFASLHQTQAPKRVPKTASAAYDLLDQPTQATISSIDLGISYPLTCWVDELFTQENPYSALWNEQKLEVFYHGCNDRAWRFWEQAEQAHQEEKWDLFEVFYLCAGLGFRGDKRENINEFQRWMKLKKNVVVANIPTYWKEPIAFDPPSSIAPHYGKLHLRQMVITGVITFFILGPACAWVILQQLLR